METIYALLLLGGLITFLAATFDAKVSRRSINFVGLGLAFWILVPLIQTVRML